MDLSALDKRVTAAIEHQPGCGSNEQVSAELAALLQKNSICEEARALNYRWQCHLNKEYIKAHNIDSFLESLTSHLLAVKPEYPIAEMLLALEQDAKTQKGS